MGRKQRSQNDTALVVMARTPRLGAVKTSLAASLGPAATLQLYRAFLADLARRFATESDYTLHWAYTPMEDDFAAELAQLVPGPSTGDCFPLPDFLRLARILQADPGLAPLTAAFVLQM